MPDRDMAWQSFQVFLPERVRNQTNIREIAKCPTVRGGDACALLPTVLQSVQAVESDLCRITLSGLWEVDANHATLIVGAIGLNRNESWNVVQGISPRGGDRWRTLPLYRVERQEK